MESKDQYHFSIFKPRNLHGRKNRNVILTMLAIWVVAVFGFQTLLKVVEKPVSEKTLNMFELNWPSVLSGDFNAVDNNAFLNSMVHVKGKSSVKVEDQQILSDALSCFTFRIVSDSIREIVFVRLTEIQALKGALGTLTGQDYIDTRSRMRDISRDISDIIEPYTAYKYGSLESAILTGSLKEAFPDSFADKTFDRLPGIMKLYLTHNQSVLTDTKFLGFPFHYFYTAVFLLVLFIGLCITYNLLIEWRLKKEGVTE